MSQCLETPIRLIVGRSQQMYAGISILYEEDDGSVGSLCFWFDSDLFKKVRFIDPGDGESRIIWSSALTGIVFKRETWAVERILIRRDVMKMGGDLPSVSEKSLK